MLFCIFTDLLDLHLVPMQGPPLEIVGGTVMCSVDLLQNQLQWLLIGTGACEISLDLLFCSLQ